MSKKQQAYVLRVYADTDAGTLIIDVPAGHLTTEYVDQAREAGGKRVRIHALDIDGATLDRVLVR
jgi:hypothetical protein